MLLSLAAALVACDGNGVPPPGQEPLRASAPQVAADEVELRADGLVAGAEAFYFAAGQSEVAAALEQALGEAGVESENAQCGVGPMTMVAFPGGLTVNFQQGSLVGWTLADASDQVRPVGDAQIGMARAEAEQIRRFASVASGSMGEEFSIGQLGGFIEGETIAMLYAGKQCIFR